MARLFVIVALLAGLSSVARAQAVITSAESTSSGRGDLTIAAFDPSDAVSPISVVEGPGWKIGEGTTLHPVFGLETGFVSNVFYTNTNEQPAGVLRLVGQIGTSSLNGARLDANLPEGMSQDSSTTPVGNFEYQASVRLAYDQMLSGDQVIQNTGGLGAGALFQGLVNPVGTVSFGIDDNYTRLIRAANFETSSNDNRDINVGELTLLLHPPGRTLSGYLYYRNMVDIFESGGNQYPDRMENRVGVHPMWRWLPETLVYADVSESVVTGIGSSPASQQKATSYPLQARVGISTLLTLRTTAALQAGYTNGFYSRGPSFSAPMIDALITYRYSPLGRLGASYDLLYTDSVNANYYRDHVLRVFVMQSLDPIVVMVQPELHFREYNGVTVPASSTVRDDTIFAIRGGIHYTFRNWIAAVLDYKFSTVQTDFRYMDATGQMIDPGFVRHELLLGVRAAM